MLALGNAGLWTLSHSSSQMTKLTPEASNKNTVIKNKIYLTFHFVVFVITPESQAIVLGHQFRLDCAAFEATDETPLTYSWEFNGQSIDASNIASKVTVFAICVGVCVRIFTARKRSLRQGNVSTPVCLSTGGRECYDVTSCCGQHLPLPPGQHPSPWTAPPQPTPVNKLVVRILLECFLVN